jgi:hypothetical protein
MLTGLKNIPRIQELKEIRTQYREHLAGEKMPRDEIVRKEGLPRQEGVVASSRFSHQPSILRDQMISLPGKKYPGKSGENEGAGKGTGDVPYPSVTTGVYTHPPLATGSREKPSESLKAKTGTDHRRYVIVAKPHEPRQATGPVLSTDKGTSIPIKKIIASHLPYPSQDKTMVSLDNRNKLKEQERKKIERELQKQRLMAMTGKDPKFDRDYGKTSVTYPPSQLPREDTTIGTKHEELKQAATTAGDINTKQEMQKIVLHKRKAKTDHVISPTPPQAGENIPDSRTLVKDRESGLESVQIGKEETIDAWIRKASLRKKDESFDSEIFKLKDVSPTVSDGALLHTDLKRTRTTVTESNGLIKDIPPSELPRKIDSLPDKSQKKKTEEDMM